VIAACAGDMIVSTHLHSHEADCIAFTFAFRSVELWIETITAWSESRKLDFDADDDGHDLTRTGNESNTRDSDIGNWIIRQTGDTSAFTWSDAPYTFQNVVKSGIVRP
jgi:hypothetical protein